MDPKTGAILAHATAPTFDLNNRDSISLAAMRNPSVQDVYEPGSTGKIMTIAAAIEENKVTPTTVFTVPYKIKRAGSFFHDHEKHPNQRLTTSGILAVSSNTGTIFIGEKLTNNQLHDYLTKFGIGASTGSGLPVNHEAFCAQFQIGPALQPQQLHSGRDIHLPLCKQQACLQLLQIMVFAYHQLLSPELMKQTEISHLLNPEQMNEWLALKPPKKSVS
jgi:cell division protein FtsI/penicillin-binding protein 2